MIYLYQDKENQRADWKVYDSKEGTPTDAFHQSYFSYELNPPYNHRDISENTRMFSDYVICDIDDRDDIFKLRNLLINCNVPLTSITLFASGSKGFHVYIPTALFCHKTMFLHKGKRLHRKHYHVAKLLAEAADIEFGAGKNFDSNLYAQKHLIRTPNKARANGRFKVQIAWHELDGMSYEELTSTPRPLTTTTEPAENQALNDLFVKAMATLDKELAAEAAKSQQPKPTYSGDAPPCVVWLISGNAAGNNPTQKIVQTASRMYANFGGFNVDEFADSNATNRTPAREVAARLDSMIKSDHDKEWSCGYPRELAGFNCSICKACPHSESYRIEKLIGKVTTNQKHIAALVKELKTATGSVRDQLGQTLSKCLALKAESNQSAEQAVKFAVKAGAAEADARAIIEGAVQEREARARKAHNVTNFEGLTRKNVDNLTLDEIADLIVQKMDIDRFFRGQLGETEKVVTGITSHDYGDGIAGDLETSEIRTAQPKPVTFLLPFAMGQGKTVTAAKVHKLVKAKTHEKFLRFKNTLPKKEASKLKFVDYAMNATIVTPRVSLTKGLASQFEVADYQGIDDKRNHKGSFATCADSLHQFQTRNPLLITDEARQTLEHITTAETVGTAGKTGRKAIFENYIKVYQSALFTLVLDADLNDEAVDFYKTHGGGREIILLEKTAPKMQAKHFVLNGGHDEGRQKALELLQAGQSGTLAATSEKQALMSYKFFKDNGVSVDEMLVLTGENKGGKKQKAFYADPSKESKKYRIIIHSPVLGSGVSIENENLTFTILLNTSVLPANEAWQMVARNRRAREIYVSFDRATNYERVTDPQIFIEAEKERVAENFIAELANNGMTTTLPLTDLVATVQISELTIRQARITATRNADLNDYSNNFVALGKVQGREFEYMEETGVKFKKLKEETLAEIAERRFNARAIDAKTAESYATSSELTQEQSDELKRSLICDMTGTDTITIDDALMFEEIYPKVKNVEKLLKPESDLRAEDTANIKSGNKSGSRFKEQQIFNEVLAVVTDLTLPEILNTESAVFELEQEQAFKICKILKKHHKSLAHFADFSKLPKSHVIARVKNYLKKYGFEGDNGREINGDKRARIYTIFFNPLVRQYVNNRAGLKANFSPTEV